MNSPSKILSVKEENDTRHNSFSECLRREVLLIIHRNHVEYRLRDRRTGTRCRARPRSIWCWISDLPGVPSTKHCSSYSPSCSKKLPFHFISSGLASTMRLERGRRASLALTLNFVAFAFALSAVCTSYWCEGTRKVPKPFCTGPPLKVKQSFCIRFNSSNLNDSRLVQYIFETGEDKFLMRKFHAGIFYSCEQSADMNGFDCRDFFEIAPEHERGVLWLCIVAETLYLTLLFMGGALMTLEQCPCYSVMNKLKLSAFAAVCTALSGLCGMVAHMMFTTIFQLAVAMGPEDWRPKTWDYSWSYALAWGSFGTCMGSAVTALNRYTKTIIEFKYKRRNIEKTLMVKQKMIDMDLPDQMWDMYLTAVPVDAETPLELLANGHKPPTGTTYVVEMDDVPEQQGEAYC